MMHIGQNFFSAALKIIHDKLTMLFFIYFVRHHALQVALYAAIGGNTFKKIGMCMDNDSIRKLIDQSFRALKQLVRKVLESVAVPV